MSLLHAPCSNLSVRSWVGCLSCTPYTGNDIIRRRVDSLCQAPRAKFCLVVCREGSFSYTPRDGICVFVRPRRSAGGKFLLHAPCWKLFGFSSGGESLLHAPYSDLSGRSSPCSNLSHLSSDVETLLRALYLNLSHRSVGISFKRTMLRSVW